MVCATASVELFPAASVAVAEALGAGVASTGAAGVAGFRAAIAAVSLEFDPCNTVTTWATTGSAAAAEFCKAEI